MLRCRLEVIGQDEYAFKMEAAEVEALMELVKVKTPIEYEAEPEPAEPPLQPYEPVTLFTPERVDAIAEEVWKAPLPDEMPVLGPARKKEHDILTIGKAAEAARRIVKGEKNPTIARLMNCTPGCIGQIRNGGSWFRMTGFVRYALRRKELPWQEYTGWDHTRCVPLAAAKRRMEVYIGTAKKLNPFLAPREVAAKLGVAAKLEEANDG